MPRSFCTFLVAFALLLAGIPQAVQAQPHAMLLRADPADGATIGIAARQLRLWFSAPIAPGAVVLNDGQGRVITLPQPRAEVYQPSAVGLAAEFDAAFLFLCQLNPGRLPGVMLLDLPQLDKGTYQLRWQATVAEPGGTGFDGTLAFRVVAGIVEQPAITAPQPLSQQTGDLMTTLTVSPNLPGQNFVTLTVTNTRRPAPAPIEQVLLTIEAPGVAPKPIKAELRSPGVYQVSTPLDTAGKWQIAAVIERGGLAASRATFDWHVPETQASLFPAYLLWLAVALLVITAAGVFQRRRAHVNSGRINQQSTQPIARIP